MLPQVVTNINRRKNFTFFRLVFCCFPELVWGKLLSSDHEDEQKVLNEKIPVLETEIERLKSECTNVQRFLDIADKYTDITELTPELLRTFVNKTVICEREKKHDKNAPQQIDI